MQIVIDVDSYVLEHCQRHVREHCANNMEEAIANGTLLQKGHGRLIDADAFERRCMFDKNIEDMQDVIYALRDYKPIIEADAESEDME